MHKLVLNMALVAVAVVSSSGLASADMSGQVVCGVPADEAVFLTWQVDNGSWRISTPAGGRISTFPTEDSAIGLWEENATFVCEVTLLVNFREFTGRFYRLNRRMQQYRETADTIFAGEEDPRELIVGVSNRPAVTDRALSSPGLASADMSGQVVCGVPADEAVFLTWQVDNGSWSISSRPVAS